MTRTGTHSAGSKALADAGYLLRLERALPTPRYGSAAYVFTLGRKGRSLLESLEIDVPRYYRPSEEAQKAANSLFMPHTLAAIDVLIAAERLCQEFPQLELGRLLTERELRREPLRVVLDP